MNSDLSGNQFADCEATPPPDDTAVRKLARYLNTLLPLARVMRLSDRSTPIVCTPPVWKSREFLRLLRLVEKHLMPAVMRRLRANNERRYPPIRVIRVEYADGSVDDIERLPDHGNGLPLYGWRRIRSGAEPPPSQAYTVGGIATFLYRTASARRMVEYRFTDPEAIRLFGDLAHYIG